jgi:AraC-like DNA-binding protein
MSLLIFCKYNYFSSKANQSQHFFRKDGVLYMPAQWTAEIIGNLHLNHLTAKQLSEQLGYNPKYVSTVLNGHRNPKSAEQTFRRALDELIQKKQKEGT